MDQTKIKQIVEAALMAADEPLSADKLVKLFKRGEVPIDELREAVRAGLVELTEEAEGRGYELKRVASGYRYQVRQELSTWVSRLWEERPPRYSRALMETLALVIYRQPVTRGDIEQVRGVAVSQNILRTLLERGWIRVVGTRDVPGKPAMYGTTKQFLDYFNLKSLNELPPLEEIREMLAAENPDDIDEEAEAAAAEVNAQLAEASLDGPQEDDAQDTDAEASDARNDQTSPEGDDTLEAAAEDDAPAVEEVRIEVEVVEPEPEPAEGSNVVRLPTQHG